MRVTGDLRREVMELGQGQKVGRRGRLAKAVPGRDPIDADPPFADGAFEELEDRAHAPAKRRAVHLGQLHLGIVHVVDVDGLDAEVRAALLELVGEIPGRHAVAAADHVAGLEDPRAHIVLDEVGVAVGRRAAVERDEAALGREHDLVATEAPGVDLRP